VARIEKREIASLIFTADESDSLYFYCSDGDLHVGNTPHYRYALGYYTGDESLMKDYVDWQIGRGKSAKIKINCFNKVLGSAKRKGIRRPIQIRGDRICDGHHRAATALALGKKRIVCRVKKEIECQEV